MRDLLISMTSNYRVITHRYVKFWYDPNALDSLSSRLILLFEKLIRTTWKLSNFIMLNYVAVSGEISHLFRETFWYSGNVFTVDVVDEFTLAIFRNFIVRKYCEYGEKKKKMSGN